MIPDPTFSITPLAWAAAPTLLLLGAACLQDGRKRRISNRLILAGLASAGLTQGMPAWGLHPLHPGTPGTPGLVAGAWAALLMLVASLTLWRLHLFGAGDAKLLTVVAAHGSPGLVMPLLLLTALAGGLLALLWTARRPALESAPTLHASNPLPYAWAIAAGHVLTTALVAAGLLNP